MAGITEDQGDKIVDLLKDILYELKNSRTELAETNSKLFDMDLALGNIKRNVDSIERSK
jgi:hypothetical protein